MTEPKTIVGIDVGTTKICTLVGEVYEDAQLRIIGVGVAPSRGLRKGVVVNVHEATEAISASVEKAERISGYEIANAFVGMASARAYRDAMPFEKVSDILLGDTGTKFDRKPVSALINFLENREGKDKWAHYRVRPKLEREENPLE